MAKTVTTASGTTFKTLKDAKSHFGDLRKNTPIRSKLTGSDRMDVIDIYNQYCVKTNYPNVGAVEVTTENDTSPRQGGVHATTKAFAVVDANGGSHIFSIDKALAAIAT